jgi:hypothetical protein
VKYLRAIRFSRNVIATPAVSYAANRGALEGD